MDRFHDIKTEVALVERCRQRRACCIYYELAPTGNVHPGIVRSLLYISSIASAVEQNGIKARIVIRLNDRSAVRVSLRSRVVTQWVGMRYADIGNCWFKESLYQMFCREVQEIVERLRLFGVEYITVTQIYENSQFQDLLWCNLKKVYELWSRRKVSRQMFYPLVQATRKLYTTEIFWEGNAPIYRYLETGECGPITRSISGGLLAFKLEAALMWRHLDVDLDVHATNHLESFKVSVDLFKQLYDDAAPLAPRLGVILGSDHRMMAKSRGNFEPVIDTLATGEFENLVNTLRRRKCWKDISL
ncbi:MAG: hypothetical protein MN733_16600 [Nitrososphaera sp.]|nr:hypothetical protein [Nitrososphaera sp.]